jgi:hypothetical protein
VGRAKGRREEGEEETMSVAREHYKQARDRLSKIVPAEIEMIEEFEDEVSE